MRNPNFSITIACLASFVFLQALTSIEALSRKIAFDVSPTRWGLVSKRSDPICVSDKSYAARDFSDINTVEAAKKVSSTKVIISSSRSITSGQKAVFKLLSGGVSGTVASCVTNPLEVIRTQLQSSFKDGSPGTIAKRVFESDGVKGFFKGLKPTLLGVIPARSIYFFSYEHTKRSLGKTMLPEGSVANSLIAGFSAGIASNTLTNPIWMVKTRIQLLADSSAGQRAYAGYGDAISSIMKEEGIGGFYKGICASYWGCIEGAIQFLIYEQMKQRNKLKHEAEGMPYTKPSKLYLFCSAALAKCTASILTYPHEVARTRLREQAREGVFRYSGMWKTIGIVAKEEGRSGLYGGMGIHLMKVVPNSAIMFLTYELVNTWLGKLTVEDE